MSLSTLATPAVDADRETLRAFAAFCETHDPRVLAAKVDDINVARTLKHIYEIERWFRHYAAGLRERGRAS